MEGGKGRLEEDRERRKTRSQEEKERRSMQPEGERGMEEGKGEERKKCIK